MDNMITELYSQYVETEEYAGLKAVNEADKSFFMSLYKLKKKIGTDDYVQFMENAVSDIAFKKERMGFYVGFKYAVKLMAESLN